MSTPEARDRAQKAFNDRNPNYYNDKQRQYRLDNPEWQLHKNCKNSARLRGHVCDLTVDQVKELCKPMVCSVTGIPLSWTWEGEGVNPWRPSLDRINNSKGYTLDNVRLVCWAFNLACSTWPDEVFDRLARSYVRERE